MEGKTRLRGLKVLLLFSLFLILGVQAAPAQPQFVAPWGPNLAPQWAPVPQVPGVSYVPNLAYDLFRYANQYYLYQDGLWRQGASLNGPWVGIQNPPQVFYNVGPTYFKNPPGWAKGKKTGWGGQPAPPGQMKKWGGEGHIPPGQMKKWGQ